MTEPEPIWGAFTAAHVWLKLSDGDAILTPGAIGSVDPFPFAQPVHIITAFNPMGQMATPDQNLAAHEALTNTLSEYEVIPSMGCNAAGEHREPGLAVLDIGLDQALAIGQQFQQMAIYQWTATERAVVSCLDFTRHPTGWSLRQAPDSLTNGLT